MTNTDLLQFDSKGIYCHQAGVYIDPWRKVDKAIITHGHSDHARYGSKSYLCTEQSVPILKHRLGQKINVAGVKYGETFMVNGVKFSFHPAGHIIGSAQVRVEYKGEVWVASGDYKVQDDGISGAFTPVKCHAFITESTFGLPLYNWKPLPEVFAEINQWWAECSEENRPAIITTYSLGKAQNLLHNIDRSIGPIYGHAAINKMNAVLNQAGLFDVTTLDVDPDKADYGGSLIVTPGSGLNSKWAERFKNASTASASGWMALRGARRRRSVDRGFVLSDHADWEGLNSAIKATGASKVVVTHGYQALFSKWLSTQGYEALTQKTLYEGEVLDQAV